MYKIEKYYDFFGFVLCTLNCGLDTKLTILTMKGDTVLTTEL